MLLFVFLNTSSTQNHIRVQICSQAASLPRTCQKLTKLKCFLSTSIFLMNLKTIVFNLTKSFRMEKQKKVFQRKYFRKGMMLQEGDKIRNVFCSILWQRLIRNSGFNMTHRLHNREIRLTNGVCIVIKYLTTREFRKHAVRRQVGGWRLVSDDGFLVATWWVGWQSDGLHEADDDGTSLQRLNTAASPL